MKIFPKYTMEEKIEGLEKAIKSWADSFSVDRDTSKKIQAAAKNIYLSETPPYSPEYAAACQAEAAGRKAKREAEAARKKEWQRQKYGEDDETRIAREMERLSYLPAHFINLDPRLKSLYDSVKKLVAEEISEEEIEIDEKAVDKIIIDIIEQRAGEVMSDDYFRYTDLSEQDDFDGEQDIVFDLHFEKSPGDIVEDVMDSIRGLTATVLED